MNGTAFLIEYLAPLLALMLGIFAIKRLTFFWKLLFLQVFIYVVAIKLAYVITPALQTNSNHWFYNSYLILEIGLLCFAPIKLFKTTFEKISLSLLYGFYLLVFAFQIYLNGFEQFANFAFAAAGFVLSIIYGYLIYLVFQEKESEWFRSPIIWASFGIVIYFACNVPYFSMFHYLNTNYLDLSRFFFYMITDVLANTRYLLLAVAFWLLRTKGLSKTQTL